MAAGLARGLWQSQDGRRNVSFRRRVYRTGVPVPPPRRSSSPRLVPSSPRGALPSLAWARARPGAGPFVFTQALWPLATPLDTLRSRRPGVVEKGGLWQPALALLREMVATLDTNQRCEKGGQWQPALALLSAAVASPGVRLTCEKGEQWQANVREGRAVAG